MMVRKVIIGQTVGCLVGCSYFYRAGDLIANGSIEGKFSKWSLSTGSSVGSYAVDGSVGEVLWVKS